MNGKILMLSTVTGVLAACPVLLIADVFSNILPDNTSAAVVVLSIGSCTHLLMRYLPGRSPGKFR